MGRRRAQAAQEAAETAEPTVDAPEVVTGEEIVQEGLSLARSIRATTVMMTVVQTPCGRLPKPLDDYPNGIGGETFHGVCLITDWKVRQEPFFLSPNAGDARAIFQAIEAEREVSWGITRPVARSSEDPEETTPRMPRRMKGLSGDGLPRRKSSRGKRSR